MLLQLKILKKTLLFCILNILFIMIFANTNDINLYIGSNYIADNTVKRVESNCNCNLIQAYFNDNDEMLAKMVAGATGYSVIVATSYAVAELIKMNKILPLNNKLLPNGKFIDAKFMKQSYDPTNTYSLPYAYNPVFLAYNEDKMKQLGIVPNTWAIIFDPKYLKKLNGKITVFNSAKHVFGAALLYLGKNPNSTNPDDLQQARELIDKSSPYWAKFDSDNYYRGLLRGDIWVAMSYSIDIFKAINDAKASHSSIHIGAILQKEGNMYELDNMVIPKTTPNIKSSYAFINTALLPQSEYELASFTGSSVPNQSAIGRLDKSISSLDWIYPKDMNKMYVLGDYPPNIRILVNEMWTEIQMTCHKITN
jgi:spermidine/putrescine transport system substrate-binding protein